MHGMALPLVRNPQPLPAYRKLTWGQPMGFAAEMLGETLYTRNYEFEVIHTPGHAPDHVALHEPEKRWLFAGDLFISERPALMLSSEDVLALQREDDFRGARNRALTFLAYRPRSRREIDKKLTDLDFDEQTVTRVLERLVELKLVDDKVFAAWWVENRLRNRPKGARALRMELRQRGIPNDIAVDAIGELDEDAMATDMALSVAERYRGPDQRAFERRLGSYLQRRGFGYDSVRAATKTAWKALDETDTDT